MRFNEVLDSKVVNCLSYRVRLGAGKWMYIGLIPNNKFINNTNISPPASWLQFGPRTPLSIFFSLKYTIDTYPYCLMLLGSSDDGIKIHTVYTWNSNNRYDIHTGNIPHSWQSASTCNLGIICLFIISQMQTHPLLEFCTFRFCLPHTWYMDCVSCMRPFKTRSTRDRVITHSLQIWVSTISSILLLLFFSFVNTSTSEYSTIGHFASLHAPSCWLSLTPLPRCISTPTVDGCSSVWHAIFSLPRSEEERNAVVVPSRNARKGYALQKLTWDICGVSDGFGG